MESYVYSLQYLKALSWEGAISFIRYTRKSMTQNDQEPFFGIFRSLKDSGF